MASVKDRPAMRHHFRAILSYTLGALAATMIVSLGLSLLVLLMGWFVRDEWLRATPRGKVDDGDVFVAFGFGICKTPEGADAPGESNIAIAHWIVANNPKHRPTIVQAGVYLALEELSKAQPGLIVDAWVIQLPHHRADYVDTRGATLQSWAVMQREQVGTPVLVSHDLQLQRVAWEFENIGLGERCVVPDMPQLPFDRGSAQLWTRDKLLWKTKEALISYPMTFLGPALYWLAVGIVIGLIARQSIGCYLALARWILRRLSRREAQA